MKTINLLKDYKIKPSKHLGQNFLISKEIIRKIIKTAQLTNEDTVLEIGSGIGNLTFELAKIAKKVVGIEKDSKLVTLLKKRIETLKFENIEIIENDVLKIFNSSFPVSEPYKVVANIPYYLTSRLIRLILEFEKRPLLIVLTVQKEVAKRICAHPPKMNLLAVTVQLLAEPHFVSVIQKKFFWPKPKVDSAIVKIVPKNLEIENKNKLFEIVKIGFSWPRKQLINNFSKKLKVAKIELEKIFLKANVNPKGRPESLTIEDWIKLHRYLNGNG